MMLFRSLSLMALLVAGVAEASSGQPYTSPRNSVLLRVGADHYRLIDQAFTSSRLKFTGTSYGMVLSYVRDGSTYHIEARVQGSTGEVAASGTRLPSSLHHIALNASFGRRVGTYSLLGTRNVGYLGVQLRSENSAVMNESLLENVSVTFLHTANVLLYQTTRLGEATGLRWELTLPLAGWLKRSAYDGGANQELEENRNHIGKLLFRNSRWSFIHPMTAPHIRISYIHRLFRNMDLSLNYRMGYVHINDNASIRSYHNGLLVGLRYTF